MANQNIQVAVTLTAYNRMAGTIMNAQRQLKAFSESAKAYGRQSITTGLAVAAPLIAAAKAYGDQDEAMRGMKSAMLQDGGRLNTDAYNKLVDFAKKTSVTLTGSTADYLKMVRVMQQNSIKPDEILGGIGTAAAKLAVYLKMPADEVAQFASRMRRDMDIKPSEMAGMMDLINRIQGSGVGSLSGAAAVTEMGEAFSKAGLGAHNLGISGLQATKDMGALMGLFIQRGLSGGTVGNNFRRIFDGLRSAEKLKKSNDIAKQYGITLDFYTKDHKFKGISSFVAELGKLKGLNTTQISSILNPFAGKQGLSTDFLELLGKSGIKEFNEYQKRLADQATLDQRVAVILQGVNAQFEIARTTGMNTLADIGETYSTEIYGIIHAFNDAFITISSFVKEHKELVSAIASGLIMFVKMKFVLGVAAFAISGLTTAFEILGLVMTANPITLALIGLAGLAYYFYKRWEPITTWFSDQWVMIKARINGVLDVAKLLFGVFTGTRNISELLNIGNVYSAGYNATMSANAAEARGAGYLPNSMMRKQPELKPNRNAALSVFQTPITIHLAGATKADAAHIGDHLEHRIKKVLREHEANKRRVGYH